MNRVIHEPAEHEPPVPGDDEITSFLADLADDSDDGHAARAVEARLTHDAHLYAPVTHEPVRQPLAIEAAPKDRPGGTA